MHARNFATFGGLDSLRCDFSNSGTGSKWMSVHPPGYIWWRGAYRSHGLANL